MSSMKCIVSATALVLALAYTTAPAPAQAPTTLPPSAIAPNPQIEIAYVEPRNPAYRPLHDKLKRRQVLEDLRRLLSPLRLPRTIQVKVEQCGTSAAPSNPGGPVVI